jgi:hypothetical protein
MHRWSLWAACMQAWLHCSFRRPEDGRIPLP